MMRPGRSTTDENRVLPEVQVDDLSLTNDPTTIPFYR